MYGSDGFCEALMDHVCSVMKWYDGSQKGLLGPSLVPMNPLRF